MANIFINVEHGIQVAATDILKFVAHSQVGVARLEPEVIAALGVLLGATGVAMTAVNQAAVAPMNIALDVETITDLRAIWPAMVKFAESLGIKL